ncbi:hypothetical protein NQZ79_g1588 [Umbelopsis isabellina]|nr:hypothetical protein NQZ79_g1588 [Umbelopsis isabellina]
MPKSSDSGYISDREIMPSTQARNGKPASTISFINGHAQSLALALIRFIFKNNNLPLLINLLHHSAAARYLLAAPYTLLRRYTQQTTETVVAPVATDMLRSVGGLHLSLAALSLLTLKERNLDMERMSLIVLSIANISQLWAHAMAYWRMTGRWNLRAIREVGLVELIASTISVIAYINSARKSKQIL